MQDSMIHAMEDSPHDTDAIASSHSKRAGMTHRKTLGAISGLPCFLDFSSTITTLAHAEEVMIAGGNGGGTDSSLQTVITINPDTFLPGSIVVYQTWMAESGMALHIPSSRSSSPVSCESPTPVPMKRLDDLIPIALSLVRSPSPDLRPRLVKKSKGTDASSLSVSSMALCEDVDEGRLER